MPASVQPVVFPNSAGNQLFGMLHKPSTNRNPGIAIVLLSPGIKGRIAPHRLYVKLARRLCDAGFLVLRFDFYGLGDAEGELTEKLVADVYGAVSVGRYVDDVIAAMNWLQQEHQTERFVLSGLCGGAITGLFAGARDPRVDALVGLAMPVIQYGDNSMRYRYLSRSERNQFQHGYIRKLSDWKSWVRLLTFRSDYSVIARVFLSPLTRLWRRSTAMKADASQPVATAEPADAGNINPYFPPEFFKVLDSAKKVFLIFGEIDRLYWDFDEKFYSRYKHEIDRFHGRFELHLVKDARHIFEERSHQEDLFHAILSWVVREYGSGKARTAA